MNFFLFLINVKLDTVSRVLTDRQWTVGDLASSTLKFARRIVPKNFEVEEEKLLRNINPYNQNRNNNSLFEELIGVDRPSP